MFKKIILIVIAIIVLLIILIAIYPYTKKNAKVTISNQTFSVEIARTESQREKGLMQRDHLDANSGMLFVFPKSDFYTIWMKDTLIPLDIIYINDNKIVEITSLQPQNGANIPQYTPKNYADYVLEIPFGTANKYNFKTGDSVEIKY